jgi:signal transduction histidine kinase
MLASLAELAERSLSAQQFIALDSMRRELEVSGGQAGSIEAVDREDALTTWMESKGIANAWRIAPALAAADVDTDWCERADAALSAEHLGPGLAWVASALAPQALLGEMRESTSRISALVNDFKSYSQLDRASVQTIDVTRGLDDTLVMLKHKLGDGVTLQRDYATDVPQIEAFPSELNQVWTNLIANAIDAVGGNGTIRIATRAEPEFVLVEIADDGPGMPPDVQARAFEPFFTTKDVGKGTGLGLDISRRIVADRHHGQIVIASEPGKTVISVRLPVPAS